eukprot:CAMPEP_0115059814 /NCGR_PEP_ID=MMETSP0227-20121206/7122_1 /TAXON_ID=89957 /ORGANISM="Polarella glacialis, Strain CCMP 1383" /LENGTH=60 /DNA_ID=CAMNT_0002444969 /DNA_START=773 /DNA_END=955 /DNA_ORIENTATION=+
MYIAEQKELISAMMSKTRRAMTLVQKLSPESREPQRSSRLTLTTECPWLLGVNVWRQSDT